MQVTLVWGTAPREVQMETLSLPVGCTVAEALRASAVARRIDSAVLDGLSLAIWERACTPEAVLREGDRLALLRPLIVDPKEARRQRYQRDGLRKTVRPKRERAGGL